ncbi:hypothetical protein CBI38_22125 [Rhodococcus oxybenzonivorans]|uniref:Uncharacterized protein n=1 Tax=Rhodococcus oxybenzonivorans TaxID=1990687 RepID=A0A2S2BZ05_9NOCA|nr:hypothetical protein CBI38_22125 [Rhodococcus oxybenzonivorans]
MGGDDRDVRCPEEVEILHGLFGRGRPVPGRYAHTRIQLHGTFPATQLVLAPVLAGKVEVRFLRMAAHVLCESRTKPFGPFSFRDRYLPRLRVAPRRRLLRQLEDPRDHLTRHLTGQKGPATDPLVEKRRENTCGRVRVGCRNSGVGHVEISSGSLALEHALGNVRPRYAGVSAPRR